MQSRRASSGPKTQACPPVRLLPPDRFGLHLGDTRAGVSEPQDLEYLSGLFPSPAPPGAHFTSETVRHARAHTHTQSTKHWLFLEELPSDAFFS